MQWLHEVAEGRYRKVKGKPEDNWVWSPQGVIDMHRPERWGVLQFSAAKPGGAKPKPDPGAGARHLLHRVYYAQRDHRKARGVWAGKLSELRLSGPAFEAVRLETTSTGFEASAPAAAKGRRWHIRSDARFWEE